jgi:hypothetical protein
MNAKRIGFVFVAMVALLLMTMLTLGQSIAQVSYNYQVYLPVVFNGDASVPVPTLTFTPVPTVSTTPTSPAPTHTPVPTVTPLPTLPAPVLDGVELIVDSPFMPGEIVTSEPGDANQVLNAFSLHPFEEFAITSVAFGTMTPIEGLPTAHAGGAQMYRDELALFRQSQGGTPTTGPTVQLFGQAIASSYSIVDLVTDQDLPTPTLIVEWVVEDEGRLWIVRIARDLSDGTNPNTFLSSLDGLTIEVGNTTATQPVNTSPSQQQALEVVNGITTLEFPGWWSGTCNVNNNPGSFRMASYGGLDACGPINTSRLVNFGAGVSQYEWQCTELAKRYLYLKYGIAPYSGNGNRVVSNMPSQYIGSVFERIVNGTPDKAPKVGDVISFSSNRPEGHVAVVISSNVNSSGNGTIGIIEQNASANGTSSVPVSNWRVGGNQTAVNWLHEITTSPPTPTPVPGSGVTTIVSVASDGTQGDDGSGNPSISANGRFIAFTSTSTNLVYGDTNGYPDIFVRDLQTGQTARISVATDGTQGNERSNWPAISADGRFVSFRSEATNLVYNDTNGKADVFVHDRLTGQTTRVSVASDGTQGNGWSGTSSISADGRFVAFHSAASNLAPGDTNGYEDIFVHDRQTGETTRVSVASNGSQTNNHSSSPSISADGWYVTFYSAASNLVSGDTNGKWDIFVHDRQTGETTRVSVASNGSQANNPSYGPSISADGRFVSFISGASNLVSWDTNGTWDIFVHDRLTGQTTRVSVASDGTQGNEESSYSSISDDGRFVAFRSAASNLVAGDTNGKADMFVHDRQTGETTRVSVASDGTQGNGHTGNGSSISSTGQFVAFVSGSTNLVPEDTNGMYDVFVRDRGP